MNNYEQTNIRDEIISQMKKSHDLVLRNIEINTMCSTLRNLIETFERDNSFIEQELKTYMQAYYELFGPEDINPRDEDRLHKSQPSDTLFKSVKGPEKEILDTHIRIATLFIDLFQTLDFEVPQLKFEGGGGEFWVFSEIGLKPEGGKTTKTNE